jgi:beta-glucanase (GH16 family)
MKWFALVMAPILIAAPYTYPFPTYPRPTVFPKPPTTTAPPPTTTAPPPVTTATPPPSGGQTTVLWEDQFNGSGAVDPGKWGFQTGRWGATSGEQQYYTNSTSNASVAGGSLNITARRETTPDRKPAPNNFTSARVVSFGKQSVTPPVRLEASIKMPRAAGLLPAFWLLGLEPGNEYNWPRQGEIDVVEIPGTNGPSFNLHGPARNNSNTDIKTGSGMSPISDGFHTYRVDWFPDRITWFVDGVQKFTVTKGDYEAKGGNWKPFSGAWPHYVLFNVAVGNDWVGKAPASTPFPQTMSIDWVKASRIN